VAFLNPEPQYEDVLKGWISEAEKDPERLIK
jgi:hypothetical protein